MAWRVVLGPDVVEWLREEKLPERVLSRLRETLGLIASHREIGRLGKLIEHGYCCKFTARDGDVTYRCAVVYDEDAAKEVIVVTSAACVRDPPEGEAPLM